MRTLQRSILCSLLTSCLMGCGTNAGRNLMMTTSSDVAEGKAAAPAPDADHGVEAPAAKKDPAIGEAIAGTATRPRKAQPLPPAGLLTAGSFDDNLDPLVFASFVRRFSNQSWGQKLAGQRLQVFVKDGAGRPVGNARVRLASVQSPEMAKEITTRALGQVTYVLPFDGIPADEPLLVHVTPPDGEPVTETVPPNVDRWEITLPKTTARRPKNLDLALVVDTTGSMTDEMKYVLGEIKGISADLKSRFPEVNQRFGLVLYRDAGDEYVTRHFDFTTAIDDFHRNLSKQSASGGGDHPEAVHKGLEQAHKLNWNLDPDTVRVVFLIGDAPPHAQYTDATMQAVNVLRRDGVAIYPIACSGYTDPCELVWRASALLTSSQFLFLTDDSGIGAAHAEPKIPYYQVEHLNKLMVRMLASELTGALVQPLPADILRTVGRKIN